MGERASAVRLHRLATRFLTSRVVALSSFRILSLSLDFSQLVHNDSSLGRERVCEECLVRWS